MFKALDKTFNYILRYESAQLASLVLQWGYHQGSEKLVALSQHLYLVLMVFRSCYAWDFH